MKDNSMKKKRKFKPYQVLCAVENENVCDVFRKFAAQAHSKFQEPKELTFFKEITKSDAYIFLVDWSSYQLIRD